MPRVVVPTSGDEDDSRMDVNLEAKVLSRSDVRPDQLTLELPSGSHPAVDERRTRRRAEQRVIPSAHNSDVPVDRNRPANPAPSNG